MCTCVIMKESVAIVKLVDKPVMLKSNSNLERYFMNNPIDMPTVGTIVLVTYLYNGTFSFEIPQKYNFNMIL